MTHSMIMALVIAHVSCKGNVAKVLLLFKQFGQNMVYTLARQTYQSIKGETKEEREKHEVLLAQF